MNYNMKNRGMPPRGKMVLDPIVLDGTPPQEPPDNLGVYPMAPPPQAQAAREVAQPDLSPGSPTASSALADPAFVAYLSKRASDFAKAQQDAAGRQKWADLANGFQRAKAWGNGVAPDQGSIDAKNAMARKPVTDLQAQNADQGQAVKEVDALQQAGERKFKGDRMRAEDDPGSQLSRNSLLLAKTQGLIPPGFNGPYTYSMHKDMQAGATLEQAKKHAEAQIAQAGAHLAETQRAHSETERHNRAMEGLSADKTKTPAKLTQELAHAADAVKQLDEYAKQGNAEGTGPLTAVNAAANPWAAGDRTTRGMGQALAIVVARGLHGGAPTKIELEEAQQYIPQAGDPPETFTRKMAAIRKTLVDRQAELRSTMQQLGTARAGNVPSLGGETAAAPAQSAPAAKARPRRTVNGETREWDGKAWVPVG